MSLAIKPLIPPSLTVVQDVATTRPNRLSPPRRMPSDEARAKALPLDASKTAHALTVASVDESARCIARPEHGASSGKLQSRKRRLARRLRVEALKVACQEARLSNRDLGAALDASEKQVREMFAGLRPFEGELLLPAEVRARFLELMWVQHEELRRRGK